MDKYLGHLKKKEVAAISLVFAILMPLFFSLIYISFAFIERCVTEYDVARLLKTSGKIILSSYSRELWHEYGLLAVAEEDIQLGLIYEEIDKLSNRICKTIEYELKDPLLQADILEQQILDYMKIRAPVLLADDFMEKISSAAAERELLFGGSASEALKYRLQTNNADEKYLEGQAGLKLLMENQENPLAQQDSGDVSYLNLKEGEGESIETDIDFSEIKPFLTGFTKKILPVYEALGTEDISSDDGYRPANLGKLTARIDNLLDFSVHPSLESLYLGEYALLYFPAYINIERRMDGNYELFTPSGLSLHDLAEERALELEQIVSGLSAKRAAERFCDYLILGFRFVPQYLSAFKNTSLQNKYQSWSEIISQLIVILSLGQITIPAETLSYFVQAAHCLYLAQKDLNHLKQGYGLPFWPEYSAQVYGNPAAWGKVQFFYRDYLRLYMLSKQSHQLAESMLPLIKKNINKSVYTRALVSAEINQGSLQYEFDYE